MTLAAETTTETAGRMAEAATALLASLAADQRAKAQLVFDDDERSNWYYTPPEHHGGITMGELDPSQQLLVHRLMFTGLSLPGYAKATAIIALESVLGEVERERTRFPRDQSLYHVSVFGEPGGSDPWGWRFQGHHVSLNCTIVNGEVAGSLPIFFGTNPAEIGDQAPLASEQTLARELLLSLDAGRRARAVISPAAPTDIVQSNRPEVTVGVLPLPPWEMMSVAHTPEAEQGLASNQQRLGLTDEHMEALRYDAVPRGLPASAMDAEGRERLEGLIRLYVDRLPEQLAAIEWAKLERAGIDGIHFAWAGGDQHRQPHYYRLQGPSLLVEYDNTQDGANHIHSVWRDPGNDFGADLLRRHYAAAH